MAQNDETDTSDEYHSESETEAAAATAVAVAAPVYKQEDVIQQHEVVQQVQIQGQPGVQEVQVQYQQLPTAAGTVTLKYDNVQYANPEFIQVRQQDENINFNSTCFIFVRTILLNCCKSYCQSRSYGRRNVKWPSRTSSGSPNIAVIFTIFQPKLLIFFS